MVCASNSRAASCRPDPPLAPGLLADDDQQWSQTRQEAALHELPGKSPAGHRALVHGVRQAGRGHGARALGRAPAAAGISDRLAVVAQLAQMRPRGNRRATACRCFRGVGIHPGQQRLLVGRAQGTRPRARRASRARRWSHGLAHHLVRRIDQKPWPGASQSRSTSSSRRSEGRMGHHVAVGRVDDHGGALHQVVTGRNNNFSCSRQVAQVITGMPGVCSTRRVTSGPMARAGRPRPA